MGYRTLVLFDNDRLEHIIADPDFGRKLYYHILSKGTEDTKMPSGVCGVVEQCHADTANLAIIGLGGSFTLTSLAHSTNWEDEDMIVHLLKEAAESIGYTLTKKRKKSES